MAGRKIIGFANSKHEDICSRKIIENPSYGYGGQGQAITPGYLSGVTSTIVDAGTQIPAQFVKMYPHMFQMRIGTCGGMPRITVSKSAYADMCCIVAEATAGEVGWVGTVKRDGMNFSVEEIFLPDQRGHAGTCEITTEGLGNLATKILEREDGIDVWNSIRFWGHVHPGNSTDPSPQDDSQMKIFRDACPDFFVRGILGRAGRMEFTVFVYESGLIFFDVPWGIEENDQDVANRLAAWRKTMGSAVKPLYGQTALHQTSPYQSYGGYTRGRMINGRWVWNNDPEFFEEKEEVSSSSPTDGVVDDTTSGMVTQSVSQESLGADQYLAQVTACITNIMRWKLWRLFRLVNAELRGMAITVDVRTIAEPDLTKLNPNNPSDQALRWFVMSEIGIREETRELEKARKDHDFDAKCNLAISQFKEKLVAMDRWETYLYTSELKNIPERRPTLIEYRQRLVAYVKRSGIDLAMTEDEYFPPDTLVNPVEVRRTIG